MVSFRAAASRPTSDVGSEGAATLELPAPIWFTTKYSVVSFGVLRESAEGVVGAAVVECDEVHLQSSWIPVEKQAST
jgi:hypothetical protein